MLRFLLSACMVGGDMSASRLRISVSRFSLSLENEKRKEKGRWSVPENPEPDPKGSPNPNPNQSIPRLREALNLMRVKIRGWRAHDPRKQPFHPSLSVLPLPSLSPPGPRGSRPAEEKKCGKPLRPWFRREQVFLSANHGACFISVEAAAAP